MPCLHTCMHAYPHALQKESFGDDGMGYHMCERVLHYLLSGLPLTDSAGHGHHHHHHDHHHLQQQQQHHHQPPPPHVYARHDEQEDAANRRSLIGVWLSEFLARIARLLSSHAYGRMWGGDGGAVFACHQSLLLCLIACLRPGAMAGVLRVWKDLREQVGGEAASVLRHFVDHFLLPHLQVEYACICMHACMYVDHFLLPRLQVNRP